MQILHSSVATAAQLAVHKNSSGFEGNLIRQRHSRRFCLETCNCRLTMEPSRREYQALRAGPEREVCHPKSIFFTYPNISHVWKQEKPTTTTLNSKKKKDRRQQQLFAASRMHTSFAPCAQTGGGKAGSPLIRMKSSLSSIKQAPFFHCLIARLAVAQHVLWQKSPHMPKPT